MSDSSRVPAESDGKPVVGSGDATWFDTPRPGEPTAMQHIPEKRQSVRPPLRVLLVALVLLAALGVVWFAVSAAVHQGGEDCPAQRQSTTERCR